MKFDSHGNLNGGIIKGVSIEDVEQQFVKNFPNSITRKRNFDGFQEFLKYLDSQDVKNKISKIWLDGSFLTNKENPNDIDMVLYFNPEVNSIPFIEKFLRNDTKRVRSIGEILHCDAYFSVDDSLISDSDMQAKGHFEYQRKYWMGQFGFDRNEHNKGIIEINFLGN